MQTSSATTLLTSIKKCILLLIIINDTTSFNFCNPSVLRASELLTSITPSVVRLNYFQPKKHGSRSGKRTTTTTTLYNSTPPSSGKEGNKCATIAKYYFATCIPGLAKVLSRELVQIGAKNVEISGNSGVYFSSNESSNVDIGLKALLWVRTAHRIMEMITSTTEGENFYHYEENPILSKEDLYSSIQCCTSIQDILGNGRGGLLTLSVNVITNGHVLKELCHSHFTALTVKNALIDKVREMRKDGLRPDIDTTDPDVPLVAVLRGDRGMPLYQQQEYKVLRRGAYKLPCTECCIPVELCIVGAIARLFQVAELERYIKLPLRRLKQDGIYW